MDAGLALGICGVALTLGLGLGALFQGHRSGAAVARELVTLRRVVLRGRPATGDAERVDLAVVGYADVNNDGRVELLVQHASGVHSTSLMILGWDDQHQFGELTTLGTGTPAGFTVGDLDGDGVIEVATVDVDWDRETEPGRTASYAEGARTELLYRWRAGGFQEVARRSLPLPLEPQNDVRWHTDPLGTV